MSQHLSLTRTLTFSLNLLHNNKMYQARLAFSLLGFYWSVFQAVLADTGASSTLIPWDGFFTSLKQSTFSKNLLNLQNSANTPNISVELFSTPLVSYTEIDKNAQYVQNVLQLLSEQDAYTRLIGLENYLCNVKAFTNVTTVKILKDFTENNIFQEFLSNVLKMDVFIQDNLFGSSTSSRRTYRILLLGLNALVVNMANSFGTSKHALNYFSVLDPLELQNFKGYVFDSSRNRTSSSSLLLKIRKSFKKSSGSSPNPPASINWIEKGAVGPVLNQGSCGSCWSFAAVAVLEGRLVASGAGNLTKLSEQQLLSCATKDGCQGGDYETAWDYTSLKGVTSAQLYPYVSASISSSNPSSTPACDTSLASSGVVTSSSQYYRDMTETEMMSTVATGGPIAIAISTPSCFHTYTSGVLTQAACPCYSGPSSINHAVTIVGYGTTSDGIDYWLVKNSWGSQWGFEGYILLERNVLPLGMCGLLTDPASPNFVSLTPQCSISNPEPYCTGALQPLMYSNINTSNGDPATCYASYSGAFSNSNCIPDGSELLPVWAWVLIGIGSALFCVLLVLLVAWCCEHYAPVDAPYNIFAHPPKEGYQLLSEDEIAAGKAPVPNSHPDAFTKHQPGGELAVS